MEKEMFLFMTPTGTYYLSEGTTLVEMIRIEQEAVMFVLENNYKIFQRVASDLSVCLN